MHFSLKKIYFFLYRIKFLKKKNNCLQKNKDKKYDLVCNSCNNLKHQRYIFENKENNQRYCLTCLKNEYFFTRYSTCQSCFSNLYDDTNQDSRNKIILIFDQNHTTVNLCDYCFQEEYDYI